MLLHFDPCLLISHIKEALITTFVDGRRERKILLQHLRQATSCWHSYIVETYCHHIKKKSPPIHDKKRYGKRQFESLHVSLVTLMAACTALSSSKLPVVPQKEVEIT